MEHVHVWGPHFHWFFFIPFLFMVLLLVFACRMFRRAGEGRRRSWCRSGALSFGCCGPVRGPEKLWEDEASDEAVQRQSDQANRDIESREPGSRLEDES